MLVCSYSRVEMYVDMLEGTINKLWGFKINFGFKHKRTLFVLISDVWYGINS